MPTITTQSHSEQAKELRVNKLPWIRSGLETVFLSMFALVLLELLFRMWGVGAEIFVQPDEVMGCRHIANKLVIWRCEGYSHDRFNRSGLRDYDYTITKPANTKRIAILGDSTTEGLQVPLEKTYPKVLERLLNQRTHSSKCEVINFACSSYSTGQELLQYQQQVVRYKPDIVIVLYNMGDAQENTLIKDPSTAEARPYFALDQNNRLLLDDSVLKINKARLAPNQCLTFLSAHSRIYGALAQANFTQTQSDSRYRKFSNWISNIIWPKGKYVSAPVNYKYSELEVTSAIIRELNAETKNHGEKLVLVTYPCLAKKSQYFVECNLLSKLGHEQGFPVINLTSTFISYPSDAKPLFYAYHLSPTGHQLVANHLAYLLEKHGLINQPP